MAKRDRNRQRSLRSFLELCDRAGFAPEPFQKRIAGAFFGSEREFVCLLPRGQGKSRLIGALAVHHLLTVPNPRVYVAAASREQASVVHEYARDFARAVDPGIEINQREIRTADGYLRVVASDAPKLHGLTPSLAVVDELQAHRDEAVYTALRTSVVKRPGAKMCVLSTAGASPVDPLGKLRERALAQPDVRTRGAITDARGPSLRMLEWRVPDEVSIGDTKWAKRANPAAWVTPAALREQREAVDEISYQRYHLNRWVGTLGSWLPPGAWAACAGEARIDDGERIWVGIDIGGTEADSACVWASAGLHVNAAIFEGEDAILDVKSLIDELCERYDVQMVLADPWHAAEMLLDLEQRGVPAARFPQSDAYMFPAYRVLHRAIVQRRLVHPDHPKLNEHVHNAIAKHSRRGWRLIAGAGNIDGAVAMAMAVSKASAPPAERPEPEIVWI